MRRSVVRNIPRALVQVRIFREGLKGIGAVPCGETNGRGVDRAHAMSSPTTNTTAAPAVDLLAVGKMTVAQRTVAVYGLEVS